MKAFVSFYTVIGLFFISVLLPSFGGAGGEIYAQDPELFEHTWYFAIGEIDGEQFLSPDSNFITELYIMREFIIVM